MSKDILRGLFIAMLVVGSSISAGIVVAGPLDDGIAAYQNGDYGTALRLYRPLAEQGDARAQVRLGFMYEMGRGVPQDYWQAGKWYRLAAEQGDAVAQNNLGSMYTDGQGVNQDYHEAVKWYRLGAEQGYALAQASLGTMYSIGRGARKTTTKQ